MYRDTHPKLLAGLLAGAVVAELAAFAALGSLFDYPDILDRPAAEVLALFRSREREVSTWFLVLAGAAACLAPVAILAGRLAPGRAMRVAVPVGIGAAGVQVIGLVRWPLLVPGFAARAADPANRPGALADYELAHAVLGGAVGETLGYLLTATWTLLVLRALHRRLAGPWFTALGGGAAILVGLGVLAPFHVPGADTANLVGYVAWSVWLLALAVLVVGDREATPADASRLP